MSGPWKVPKWLVVIGELAASVLVIPAYLAIAFSAILMMIIIVAAFIPEKECDPNSDYVNHGVCR